MSFRVDVAHAEIGESVGDELVEVVEVAEPHCDGQVRGTGRRERPGILLPVKERQSFVRRGLQAPSARPNL